MAHDTTILNGDVGVWWLSNNRTKMLDWLGGTNDDYTMNELYSAMQTLQDEQTTIDDGTCFNADTPVEYTIGKIDTNDNDPFYITFALMQRIKGGSLRTNGWAHVNGSNTGIIIVKGTTGTNMDSTDLGDNVAGGTDGNGTLLEVIDDGADAYLVIRPDSSATGDEFQGSGGAQTITSDPGGHTFAQTDAQTSGNMIWANIYSIGTIDPEVHLYTYQGARATTDASVRVFSVNSTTVDYWDNGHFDICVPIKEYDSTTWAVVDDGYLRVFARKGGDLFSSFEVANSITSGGRNPVPLQSSLDLDAGYSSESARGHGTRKITTGVWTGTFLNGEIIQQASTLARGIIDLTNSTVDTEIVYWPICKDAVGGELTAMADTFAITSQGGGTGSGTATGAAAVDGAADSGWFIGSEPTITFANAQVDVDNNGTPENYGITVNCNNSPLTQVYQWMKYICQFGEGDTDTVEAAEDLIFGEEYEGATAYFGYDAISGTIDEGEAVTQLVSGAKGIIISHDAATNDIVLLRSTRGSFAGTDNVEADDDSDTFTPDETGNFAATVAAPLGTFAGGTYFGARGVVLSNVLGTDENSYILTDIEGNARQRPTSITLTVTNLSGNAVTETDADIVAIYELTGASGDIQKDTMLCDGAETVGDSALSVDAIPNDAPASGRLVLVDSSDAYTEYVIPYSSYHSATDRFTLDAVLSIPLAGGTSTAAVVATGNELDGASRGDIIVNESQSEVAYVTACSADANTVYHYPTITGQTSGDTIHLNAVPDITVAADDHIFVPYMLRHALASSEEVAIIYPGSTVYFRVKVRNSRETDLLNGPIKPYSSDGFTSGTDQSIPTVRTIDTIIS